MRKNTGMNLLDLFITLYFLISALRVTTHSAEEITITLLKLRIGFC